MLLVNMSRELTRHLGRRNSLPRVIASDKPDAGGANATYVICGPYKDTWINFASSPGQAGAITNESLLAIVIDRLQGFQRGPFPCRENALALTKIEEALHWLHSRTRDRIERGVEGVLHP